MPSWTKRMLVLALVACAAVGVARVFGAGRHGEWAAELGVLVVALMFWAIADFFASRSLNRAIAESHELYEQLRREQFGDV